MTKIYDDPNMRRGNPDNEDMRTTVLINDDTAPWEQKAVDRTTLKSDLPIVHVDREPVTRVHGTEYPRIG